MEPMTNDAMTKTDAARERVWKCISDFHFEPFHEDAEGATDGDGCEQCEAFIPALQAYGDRRAVEAEIEALLREET